jgi:hypothetical protein
VVDRGAFVTTGTALLTQVPAPRSAGHLVRNVDRLERFVILSIASVLQQGEKSANIYANVAVIWGRDFRQQERCRLGARFMSSRCQQGLTHPRSS